jgi:light-regulated signal transduction histidine kinase (bacteriophytochrome)
LEAFSYSVSHDLRAPLRHINGYVDLLNERFREQLPEKARHYLVTVTDAAKQMGTLIDDLLQFSRTGRKELHLTRLDMNVVVQGVLGEMKQDLKGRSIQWKIARLPHVDGDPALLRLVWSNLLGNALKFTRVRKKARIEIGLKKDRDEYIFFISDNGAGFDMRYANKLFGVFQRLHSADEFEGTGIGLANVRRIILKHRGRTWAEAKLDIGATFYFSLPKKKEG